jgi:hypothetical protein
MPTRPRFPLPPLAIRPCEHHYTCVGCDLPLTDDPARITTDTALLRGLLGLAWQLTIVYEQQGKPAWLDLAALTAYDLLRWADALERSA